MNKDQDPRRVAVITGASSGIGEATARALAAQAPLSRYSPAGRTASRRSPTSSATGDRRSRPTSPTVTRWSQPPSVCRTSWAARTSSSTTPA